MRKFLFWVTDQTEIISTCLKQISFLKMLSMMQLTKICTQSVKTFGIPKFSRKSIRKRKMRGILCWHSLRVSRGRLKKGWNPHQRALD